VEVVLDASATTASKLVTCHAIAPSPRSSVAATAMRRAISLASARSPLTGLVSNAGTVSSLVMVLVAVPIHPLSLAMAVGATMVATLVLPLEDGLIEEAMRLSLARPLAIGLTRLPPPQTVTLGVTLVPLQAGRYPQQLSMLMVPLQHGNCRRHEPFVY
jgi:hypothetical protein